MKSSLLGSMYTPSRRTAVPSALSARHMRMRTAGCWPCRVRINSSHAGLSNFGSDAMVLNFLEK